jgi:aryl-alcohol dehydrogenase-like predicted oxidoreductase
MTRTTPQTPIEGDALTPPTVHKRGGAQATTTGTRRFATRLVRRPRDFYSNFPRNLTVSALGIGTYLGDCTDEDDERYRASVLEAITSGVNVVDTAINYRCQRSERAIGLALEGAISAGTVRRDEILVCTKGGYVALDGAPPESREAYERFLQDSLFGPGVITPDDLVRGGHCIAPAFLAHQLAKSRANLGLRTIDLYYLHNPEEQLLGVDKPTFLARVRAAFEFLEERANVGEIAAYGCATWNGLLSTPEQRQHLNLAELVAIAREVGGATNHFRAVMLPVSLAMPEAARTPTQPLGRKLVPLLEAAEALGLGVVASAPLMHGQLVRGLPKEIHELFPHCTTDAQRALRFASSLPAVSTVLAGSRRTEHVRENLDAWKEPVSAG